jgi:hypothetical protein
MTMMMTKITTKSTTKTTMTTTAATTMTTMLRVVTAIAAISCDGDGGGGGAAAAAAAAAADYMCNMASRFYKLYSEHLVIYFSLLMSQMSQRFINLDVYCLKSFLSPSIHKMDEW